MRDRQHFLSRLLANPGFLCRHTPALSAAVYRKLANAVRLRLVDEHRGLKQQPQCVQQAVRAGASSALVALPQYPPIPEMLEQPIAAQPGNSLGSEEDPEREFASHRWGFLIDSILAGHTSDRGELRHVQQWIESHPNQAGAAWETYSACERVANLLLYVSIRGRSTLGSAEPHLVQFIAGSLEWIDRHLEYYGHLTNNHLLNNARALVMGGAAIGNSQAYEAGQVLLQHTLPNMVLGGGFLRERSSHYQLIVLGWILDAWKFTVLREGAQSPAASSLAGYTRSMAQAAGLLCDARGELVATIGDVSPDVDPLAAAHRLAALYPEVWPVTQAGAAVEIRDGWFRSEGPGGLVLGNFPAGSYPLPYPHHGHSDYSSFVWKHGDANVLVDTGRYRYTADAVSTLQVSARGHNVPLVDDFAPLCETLLNGGLWWPQPYANSTLSVVLRERTVILAHDGFSRSTPVKRHVRELTPLDSGLLVVDLFEGEGAVDLQLCWNFGADFTTFDSERLTASGPTGAIVLAIEGVQRTPAVTFISGTAPGAWCSPEYGKMNPSLGISLSWRVDLPARLATQFEIRPCAA